MDKKTIKEYISNITKDIRFWIILLLVIRLYAITLPPIEVSHSWRQTTVAMAARNFYEIDNNILYPRIDISEDLSGITGMEFPIFNYLIYIISLIFGYTHWYGRVINLIITSIGCYYFYRLIKKYFSERISFCSTIILLTSIWLQYSRKIMPDTFSMSLVIIGLYYGTNYLEQKSKSIKNITLYVIFCTLGILSKLPSGYILIIFTIHLLDNRIPLNRKISFCLSSLLMLIPIIFWYFYWVPYLVDEYGLWHFFMGKSFSEGISEIIINISDTLKHFYQHALMYIGFVTFIIGLVICFIKKEKLILKILSLSFLAFCVIIFKSGWTFAHHEYYIIPFVPIMSLVAGYAIASIEKKYLRVILLLAIAIENFSSHTSDYIVKGNRKSLLELESVCDRIVSPEELIVINSGADPTAMYFVHRKGWVCHNNDLLDKTFVTSLHERGAEYIIILKKAFGSDMKLDLPRIYDSEDYDIYRIEQ